MKIFLNLLYVFYKLKHNSQITIKIWNWIWSV